MVKHKGVDIFAPENSELKAPITGLGEQYSVKGYGKVYTLSFPDKKKKYVLFFAHLSSYVAGHRVRVEQGTVFARAGCTGNATKEDCGREINSSGARTDHVHVELWTTDGTKMDPVKELGWQIATPE